MCSLSNYVHMPCIIFMYKSANFSIQTQKTLMWLLPLIWIKILLTEKERPKWVKRCLVFWAWLLRHKHIQNFQLKRQFKIVMYV